MEVEAEALFEVNRKTRGDLTRSAD